MSRDPWTQRFDESAREDEDYRRRMADERMERAREKASLAAPPAALDVSGLEPDYGPIPSFEYQGDPRVHEKAGLFDSWLEAVGFVLAILFCVAIGAAVLLAVLLGVAWAMSG